VDFERRISILEELKRKEREMTGAALAWELTQSAVDGRIKLYVMYKALTHRRSNRGFYDQGEYLPLAAKGPKSVNVCAFMRRKNSASTIVAVPRLLTGLISGTGAVPFGKGVWEDTMLILPEAVQGESYRNVFTGEIIVAGPRYGQEGIFMSDAFASFPVAMLERNP
jgi:(1->4)-alpha-D-glucan 1-alpha-D-glucosylmutase